MIRVIIESPLGTRPDGSKIEPGSPEWNENVSYARACALDCIRRGESPYASHLFFPQFLDDATPEERKLGIEAGLVWGKAAELKAVYTDRGITEGMRLGIARSELEGQRVEYRRLGPESRCPICKAPRASLVPGEAELDQCRSCGHCTHRGIDLDGIEHPDGSSRGTCTVCGRKVVTRFEGHVGVTELAPEGVS